MGELYKPGEDNKPKGTYKEVGPRGGNVQGGQEVKLIQATDYPYFSKGNKWTKK